MQLLSQLSPKTARRTGFFLFVLSCCTVVAAMALPFVSLPVSGPVKTGLITALVVGGELAFATSLALLGKAYFAKLTALISLPDAPYTAFFAITGVIVWAVATLALRLWGHYILILGNTPLTIGAFVGVAGLMIALMQGLYRAKAVPAGGRLTAAVVFALPGMVLDAGTVFFFSDVFPNMRPDADALFAAWLFWGYSIVLLTGIVLPGKPQQP
ncbi:MAG: DUF5367 domain-containing protein [Bacteroidetes bacterium]|nr:DUF5367 domain-containing protein [Fibrella sp.]